MTYRFKTQGVFVLLCFCLLLSSCAVTSQFEVTPSEVSIRPQIPRKVKIRLLDEPVGARRYVTWDLILERKPKRQKTDEKTTISGRSNPVHIRVDDGVH